MTHEIREQKEKELADLNDTIGGLKHLLKQRKKRRKKLIKELRYRVAKDDREVDIDKILQELNIEYHKE